MSQIRNYSVLFALVMFWSISMVSATQAGEKHPAIHGTISQVEGGDVTIQDNKGQPITVKTDDQTKVKIDGKDAAVSDLKAGMHVTVPAYQDVATRINATTHGH